MNDVEISYLQRNLPGLIKSTKVTTMLLAKLLGDGVLSEADIDDVVKPRWNQSRTNAYHTVERILREECQTGAADIFQKLPGYKLVVPGSPEVNYGLINSRPRRLGNSASVQIPLTSVDVTATVVHAVAKVRVTQVYQNSAKHPIEAIYHFPTNPEGAITHFQAELEGRVIKGVVKSQEEAQQMYESAVESGRLAALGEEIKPDIFKVWVGSIQPRTGVKVVLEYVTKVKNEPGSEAIRVYIPTSIAPRFVSQNDANVKEAEAVQNIRFSPSAPAPLTINVKVLLQGKIKSVSSPSHGIQVELSKGPEAGPGIWHKAVVGLAAKVTAMDRDFVLYILPEEAHKPRMYSEKRTDGSTCLMIHMMPSFTLDAQKTELFFVLDRSGSMEGKAMDLAKKTLSLFLHSMPADCYFNVVCFGSTHEFLFPGKSVRYDDGNLQNAVLHSQRFQADLGGTDIFTPLQAVYSCPSVEGYLRQIFLLTDGEVSNTDGVIGLVNRNAHKARVFALGIGHGVSHHLIEGVAKAGGGTAEFVQGNESLDRKVLKQLKNALQPSMSSIELNWEDWHFIQKPPPELNTEKTLFGYRKPTPGPSSTRTRSTNDIVQSPKQIPPIFDGQQLLIFATFPSTNLPKSVTITAQSPDGPLSLKLEHTEEDDISEWSILHDLAAVTLVREMEMEVAALPFDDSIEDDFLRAEELRSEIINIACKYGIASKYTSFICVDLSTNLEGNGTTHSQLERIHVPSQLPNGWHVRQEGSNCSEVMYDLVSEESRDRCGRVFFNHGGNEDDGKVFDHFSFILWVPKSKPRGLFSLGFRRSRAKGRMNSSSSSENEKSGHKSGSEIRSANNSDSAQFLHRLISCQSFDGHFELSEAFCELMGTFGLDGLEQIAEKEGVDDAVVATACAIVVFTEKFPTQEKIWGLVWTKAREWLIKELSTSEKVVDIFRIATSLIQEDVETRGKEAASLQRDTKKSGSSLRKFLREVKNIFR